MALKIRMTRKGSHKRPFYRIVVADVRSPRDGKFLEVVGTYNPLLNDENDQRIKLKADRISYWLSVGAMPSDRVQKFIDKFAIKPLAKAS